MYNRDDMVSKVFGCWRVVAAAAEPEDYHRKRKFRWWLCRCEECGKERVAKTQDLTSGKMAGCGCKRRVKPSIREMGLAECDTLANTKWGKLTVIRQAPPPPGREMDVCNTTWWECQCECKRKVVLPRHEVTRAGASCGCGGKRDRWLSSLMPTNRKCAECGDAFDCYSGDRWGYKSGGKVFCSYRCMRKWQGTQKYDRSRINDFF